MGALFNRVELVFNGSIPIKNIILQVGVLICRRLLRKEGQI